ncbi:uncharacterized protein TNCV_1316351 [Trichonephila clavipes]|nr:uncharacterized protein TNCV_1316351 [Trichonephila clavipes]
MLDVTKYPPSAHGFTCRNCGGGDRDRVAIYRPFGEVSLSLNRTVTCMVLKANDRRTSCPCHDEFPGARSDYVRQVALATTTTTTNKHMTFTFSFQGLLHMDEASQAVFLLPYRESRSALSNYEKRVGGKTGREREGKRETQFVGCSVFLQQLENGVSWLFKFSQITLLDSLISSLFCARVADTGNRMGMSVWTILPDEKKVNSERCVNLSNVMIEHILSP